MTRTILLADDSVTIQKVVELTFMDEDFRVVSVGSGTEAIERLDEVAPDVVIADVHMPGADGYEVAEHVRSARPGTPVLLLAGTFEVFDADRAETVGAAAHLKKPFDSQELLRRVRELAESAPSPVPAASKAFSAETHELPTPTATPALSDWSIPVPDEELGADAWTPEPAVEPEPSFEPAEHSAGFEALPALEEQPPYEVGAEPLSEPALSAPPASVPPEWHAEPAPVPDVAATRAANGSLSDEDVERIARRLAELIGDRVVRDVAWEVVPDLAEVLLKARIRELESSVE
jgi:CheY-like chemotaxis protein